MMTTLSALRRQAQRIIHAEQSAPPPIELISRYVVVESTDSALYNELLRQEEFFKTWNTEGSIGPERYKKLQLERIGETMMNINIDGPVETQIDVYEVLERK